MKKGRRGREGERVENLGQGDFFAVVVVVVVVVAFIYSRLLNRHTKSLLQEYLLGRGRGRGRGSNVMWRKRREEEV